jgi:hypothetical protein
VLLLAAGALITIAIVAFTHPKGRQAPRAAVTTATPAPSPTNSGRTAANSASARQPLIVLNGSSTVEVGVAAQRFRAGGWVVAGTGSFGGAIRSTSAFYDPAVPGARASVTALRQQFAAIRSVLPRIPRLPAGAIVVVLTRDYS